MRLKFDLDLFSLRFVSIPKYFEVMMIFTHSDAKMLRMLSSELDIAVIPFSRFRRRLFRHQQGRLHSGIFAPVASRRVTMYNTPYNTEAACSQSKRKGKLVSHDKLVSQPQMNATAS